MGGRKISSNQIFVKNLILFLIWVFLLWGEVTAQSSFSISQIMVYDQNIFRNYLKTDDWVSQTTANFQQQFQLGKLPVRFDYTGDLNLFYYYHDRLSHAHQMGLESAVNFNKKIQFNFGAAFQLQKFKPEFNFYDYQTLTPYIQLHWDFWQTTPMQSGYRFRDQNFKNLAELSYQEHHGFFQIKHFFPTRTTFISDLNFGQKKYTNLQLDEKATVVTHKNSGQGRGQSHGWGNGTMASDTSVVACNMTVQKAQLFSLSLKFAQSIFSKTGMSIAYVKQVTPSNNIRYLTGMEYSYSKDDELYDDPYAYGSDELEVTVTQILPWQSALKIYTSLADKNYLYSVAVDSTSNQNLTNEKRSDQHKLIGITVQKNFKIDNVLKSLSCYVAANYLANQSNDRYFDFEGFFVYSGFELVF